MTLSTPEPTPPLTYNELTEMRGRHQLEWIEPPDRVIGDVDTPWCRECGERHPCEPWRLLDEVDRLRAEMAEANKWIYWSKRNTASAAEQHKRHYDEHDEDREAWQQVRDEMTSEILDLREENRALAAKLAAAQALADEWESALPTVRLEIDGVPLPPTSIIERTRLGRELRRALGPAEHEDHRESATTPPEGDTDE